MSHETADERRALYRTLCASEASIPLFSTAFWLDAVAGPAGWDVVFVHSGGRIDAAHSYCCTQPRLRPVISMPALTQTGGPWLRPVTGHYSQRLGREKELLTALIEALEQQAPFERFDQRFHHQITNWLPFYWRGYTQSTRYTYILDDLSDLDAIWSRVQGSVRTDVRKAKDRSGLRVVEADDTRELLRLTGLTFERQAMADQYDPALVARIDAACRERGRRKIFLARDKDERTHAAVYLVWDDNSAYYLIAGADPQLRSSGAQTLLAWEAIRFAASVTKAFDFEGSMLEPVERFVRAFGARQVPYFAISKSNSLVREAANSALRLISLARKGTPWI